MKRILDLNYGIPYYTNNSDQIFAWYVIYDDKVIILEQGLFSTVNFNNIPKENISYFGLYGNNMHLTCDFHTKSLFVYTGCKENEFLYECKYSLYEGTDTNVLSPFQFKGFSYDIPINNDEEEKFLIHSFYLGWEQDVMIDKKEFTNKIYFSINTLEHRNSIGLIYKLLPKDSSYPQNKKYRLLISDTKSTIIDGVHTNKSNKRNVYLDHLLRYKTIFRF